MSCRSSTDQMPSVQLQFPPTLTARQRAIVHEVGDAHNIPHSSQGEGADRFITLGDCSSNNIKELVPSTTTTISDDEIISFILEHLLVDASLHFSSKSTVGNPPSKAYANVEIDISQFSDFMQHLIELERLAELTASENTLSSCTSEQAQNLGQALLNLKLDRVEGGLLGRTLLTLVRNKPGSNNDESIPPHSLSPHDIVRIRPAKDARPSTCIDSDTKNNSILAQGIVYRIQENAICIAVDDMPEERMDVPLKIEKLANEVTYARLKQAMAGVSAANYGKNDAFRSLRGDHGGFMKETSNNIASSGVASALIDVLFYKRQPMFHSKPVQWSPINQGLDPSQRQAVEKALSAVDVCLVHGPPGTGKTTAVVEIIAQEVSRGHRVLACAASNIAVDNLVERLAAIRPSKTQKNSIGDQRTTREINVVRVGHPARLLPQVLENSLEAKVLCSDDSSLARDCRKEIKNIHARLAKLGRKDRTERQQLRKELRQLTKEERIRQERAIERVLQSAHVIATTLTGVGGRQLTTQPPFDVVVIDEAAQAMEPACWIALLRGRKAILAGDHLQLPPTILSEEAARKGLEKTLFERIHGAYGDAVAVLLTTQYRMNESIMRWSSEELYESRLIADEKVAGHMLGDLPSVIAHAESIGGGGGGVERDAHALPVLLLIDSAGCNMEETREECGDSKLNRGEAQVVMAHAKRLIDAGVAAKDIGIITPYSAHVGLLRSMRPAAAKDVEISTVDGFQGREKEAIVISMVRSNTQNDVGFLSDARRMNVAVTRARRHCALVCDSETVKGGDEFLKRLVEYFEEHGEYACAEEYVLEVV